MIFTYNPHPKAPLFRNPEEASLLISQAISEIASRNLSTSDEILREVLRQAGFINLWYFLKFIAGHSGPYNLINDRLHLDMCNFRQSPACMSPGARFGAFIPRSGLKSTIMTHGSASWEALRFPDIRILILNSIEDRAYEFATLAFKTFRDNELVRWLYPEYAINPKSAQMTLPNRSRFYPDDTWNYRGFGGALEGTHNDVLLFDDIVGQEDLDSTNASSISMEKAKSKFGTASRALLISQKTGRVGLIGTRYSPDDVYEARIQSCRAVYGYKEGNIKPVPGGVWDIYYRKWREHGVSIEPETYVEAEMRRLLEEDPWSYWNQYENDPKEGSALELYKMQVNRCVLEKRENGYYLVRLGTFRDPLDVGEVALGDCYCAIGVDFAGTSTGITAKTSKSAFEFFAEDGEGRIYLVEERTGYWDGSKLVKELFDLNRKFTGYINMNILESNAMQVALIPLIRDMAFAEDLYFPYEPTPVSSPKDVRIRTIVGTALGRGNVYCVETTGHDFLEQKDIFPQSNYKKDALDAAAKAIQALKRPFSDSENEELRVIEEEESQRVVSRAGY